MKVSILEGKYSVCRFSPSESVCETQFSGGAFTSVTRTTTEISVVCETECVRVSCKEEKGWSLLMVEGPLDFGMIGVLSSISAPLAAAGISIFVLSTFDTDYILLKESVLDHAVEVMRKAGFELVTCKKIEHTLRP